MASLPKNAVETAGVILSISPNDVLVGERLGAFWPIKSAAIGRLMATDGQETPILVRRSGPRAAKPWTLIAGLHRLEGAKGERLLTIDAIERHGDDAELLRVEASENIERCHRSPLERANFVRALADAAEARVQGLHEGLTPEQIAVRARWDGMKAKAPGVERDQALNDAEADHTAEIFSGVYGWQESVAEAIGMTSRTVRNDLALHRALVAPFPTVWRALATHPIVGENASALRDIASIVDLRTRRALIEDLIAAPDMTLSQAMDGLGLTPAKAPPAQGASKYMNNAEANIARLSFDQQRSWAPALAAAIKPQALVAMREALDARIAAEGLA